MDHESLHENNHGKAGNNEGGPADGGNSGFNNEAAKSFRMESFNSSSPPLPHRLLRDSKNRLFWTGPEKGGENRNLQISLHTPSRGWGQGETLAQDVFTYDVTLLSDDSIQLVSLDRQNCFTLLSYKPGELTNCKEEVFHQEEEDKIVNGLHLITDGQQRLHLVYFLSTPDGERWWLMHLRLGGKGWENTRVIDFGSRGSGNQAYTMVDCYNRLHLVYRVHEGSTITLYYRVFSSPELSWSKAATLSTTGNGKDAGGIFFPFLVEDTHRNLHLTWCLWKNNRYTVMYQQRVRGGWPAGRWYPPVELSPSMENPAIPFLEVEKGQLRTYWFEQEERKLYCRTSFNHGKKWGEIEDFPLKEGTRVIKMISSSPEDRLPRPSKVLSAEPDLLPLNLSSPKGEKSDFNGNYHGSSQAQNTDTKNKVFTKGEQPTEILPGENEESQSYEVFEEQEEEDFSLELNELQNTTGSLFAHTAELSRSRFQMQQELETKKSEVRWISYHSQKRLEAMRRNLEQKEKEIKQMEDNFNQTINNLKQKFQQTRNHWNQEIASLRKENQELKQKHRDVQVKLKNREEEISRLSSTLTRLRTEIKELQSENNRLKEQPKSPIGEFFSKLLHTRDE